MRLGRTVRQCAQQAAERSDSSARNAAGAAAARELRRASAEDSKWQRLFQEPSMWWDNRANKRSPSFPDFKRAATGEGLWLDSPFCPEWVVPKLQESKDVSLFMKGASVGENASSGQGQDALEAYRKLRKDNVSPSIGNILAALKQCSSSRDLQSGRKIHSDVIESGSSSDVFVATTLVDMYAKCGSMADAAKVFEGMQETNSVAWNCLIMGYALNGEPELALDYYERMKQKKGLKRDSVTYVAALKACTSLAEKDRGSSLVGNRFLKAGPLKIGKAIQLEAARCPNIFVQNSLVTMYVKCGSMRDAREVFDKMKERTVVSWTSLIMGYAQNGEPEVALELFSQMRYDPDALTFVAVLKACAQLAEVEKGELVEGKLVKVSALEKIRQIHSQVEKKKLLNEYVSSSLVDAYAKCGGMVEARKVFKAMDKHDVVSWTAIIAGYLQSGEAALALRAFEKMQEKGFEPDAVTFIAALRACAALADIEEGKPVDGVLVKAECLKKVKAIHFQAARNEHDRHIYLASTLVDVYAKCGSMADASSVFDKMEHRDRVSWTAIIRGYSQCGEDTLALQFYSKMKDRDITPDAVAFVAALKACGNLAALEAGKRIHAEICNANLETDASVANVLIEFYGKCGSMKDAEQVFDSIPSKDMVVYGSLLGGYSRQGDSERAFETLDKMLRVEKLRPNGTVFASILTACSHAGLVDKGKEYFVGMRSQYGVAPEVEHYTCMVDLLGRANRLDEAVEMVKDMPHEPDKVIWMALLAAARKWKNVTIGRMAFKSLLKLDDKNAAAYVLMANIYSTAGMWEKAAKIHESRLHAGAWKKPGQSWWTDEQGKAHTLSAGDKNHPQSEEMRAKLDELMVKLKEQEGFVPDLDCSLLNKSDTEKQNALCGHSERLAIACALINTAPGTAIRIVKNLRICEDCHKVTALVSKVEGRTIVCRDASRFHTFRDGKCSCGDFW